MIGITPGMAMTASYTSICQSVNEEPVIAPVIWGWTYWGPLPCFRGGLHLASQYLDVLPSVIEDVDVLILG